MAGDIEEPFSLSIRADSFSSGSISFGRYETESLCWERRSSFSHNKYLEEVEKYSRPGSVNEKKAYFEAHFRRRALLRQSSSDCQNGTDYQNSETDISESMGYEQQFEQRDRSSDSRFSTESSAGSVSENEHDVMHYQREDHETLDSETRVEEDIRTEVSAFEGEETEASCSVTQFESAPDRTNTEGCDSRHLAAIGAQLDKAGSVLSISAEPGSNIKDNLLTEVSTSDSISKAPSDSCRAEKTVVSSLHLHDPFHEVKDASQTKSLNHKIKFQVDCAQDRSKTSSELSRGLRKPDAKKTDVSATSNAEKKLSIAAAPTGRSMRLKPKPEVPHSAVTKALKGNSPAKDSQAKRITQSKSVKSGNTAPRAHDIANRSKVAVRSRPGMAENGSAFSFRGQDCAKKRNEEKTEAELKQFRRSLNFKAKPMPSFYNEAAHAPNRNKAATNSNKSCILGSKPLAKAKSPACSEVGSIRASSISESPNTMGLCEASGPSDCPTVYSGRNGPAPVLASRKSHLSQAGVGSSVTVKKEQVKKHTYFQNSSLSKFNKTNRSQKVDQKQKVGAARNNNIVMRKEIKGTDLVRSSRIGHVAVGVAS